MTASSSPAGRLFPQAGVDPVAVRQAFAHYPSGVVALISETGEEVTGVVASSFTVGISADPPLVSVAMQRTSTSWPRLRDAAHIGVSVFSADQAALARQMAGSDRAARFSGVDLVEDDSEARFIQGAAGWFDCVLYDEVPAGDHTIALLKVVGVQADLRESPLVFHGSSFRRMSPGAEK
jgi:flavin reductase (DIM6/NTAB) family NADH-FMN oxidoreductase RutF